MQADSALDNMSTDALFAEAVERATSNAIDDDAYWSAAHALQRRDPKTVFALVAPLAHHRDARLRALVPDVLRFLGGKARPLADETVSVLQGMLRSEQPTAVICAIATAFVDLQHPSGVAMLRPFVAHADASVREAVVHGLLPVAARAIPELIQLSSDVAAKRNGVDAICGGGRAHG
jgi:hypothetical protein